MVLQTTINRSVHAIGVGVHTAAKVRMTLRPAREHTGVVFVRADRGGASVAATPANVCDTLLSTSVGVGDVRVNTVEHLLSALWGAGVDNLIVELNGDELPIMDGSAAPFLQLLRSVGLRRLPALRQHIGIKREVRVQQGDAWARLTPHEGFAAQYTFVADHPVFNRYPKTVELDFGRVSYATAVAQARSFGLVSELPQAQKINRCLASSLDNAVGIDDDGILNPEGLRCHDEFVKHKLLDAIGDLYLLGAPLLARFEGYMSGHALNTALARAVLDQPDAWEYVSFGGDVSAASSVPAAQRTPERTRRPAAR